jgi:adenylate cyclase
MSKKAKKKTASNTRAKRQRMLGLGAGLTLFVLLLSLTSVFERLELYTLDLRFRQRGPREMTVPAAVVAIDDESLNGWAGVDDKPHYMPERWVWPRDFHAKIVDNLKAAGAKLVAFDVVFSESSKREPMQDVVFAKAVKDAGNVVMAERHVPKSDGSIKTETLIPGLAAGAVDKGHIGAEHAADDSLRELQPLFPSSAGDLDVDKPNLDLAVMRQLLFGKAIQPSVDVKRSVIKLGDREIPFHGDGLVEINYGGEPQTVPTFPYHAVYYKDMDMSVFKGKVVYVGATSEILHDNHLAPFAPAGRKMPGVEAHIHLLDTMVSGLYLRRLPPWADLLITLGLGLLITILTARVNAKQGAAIAVLIGAAYLALGFAAFLSSRVILPLAAPSATVFVVFAVLASVRAINEEREARSTRAMFSRYVSRQIVEEILHDPEAVGLGGQMKEVTILFSDVRGFTAMSEKLSAPEVVTVLNEYLTAMVDIVIANNGTVDKYVGDAIMAVWGSPLPDPQHKQNGVRTAVQMMEVLKELQAKWAREGKPHIDIGIGLNTGHVVAGNMGHPDYKMDYTVIGDDVNLAARMESANKEMRSHVLITGSTFSGCEDMVDVIKHPPIHVKGKEAAIDVIEVIGWKGQGRAPWAEPLPLH